LAAIKSNKDKVTTNNFGACSIAGLRYAHVPLQGCDMVGDLTAGYFNGHDSSRIFLVNHVIHQRFPPTTLSGRLPERANYTPM